jgi:hypothetical protein
MPRSIANKISLAALSLTMAVVLSLGTASYLFTRHTLKTQIEEKLSFEADLISHRLEARLDNINNDMRNMSANLIVVNALVDSAGRRCTSSRFSAAIISRRTSPACLPCAIFPENLLSPARVWKNYAHIRTSPC